MKPLTPNNLGADMLSKMFIGGTPETAVRRKDNDKRQASNANAHHSRDKSKNSLQNMSHTSHDLTEFGDLKKDLSKRVFYEKRELEIKYATLHDQYEKVKGKYERMKKDYVRLKEKYKELKEGKDRDQDAKSYRPTADEDEHMTFMEEGEKTNRSIQPQPFIPFSVPIINLLESNTPEPCQSPSVLDAENAQLRQEIHGLKTQLQAALKNKSKEEARNKKYHEMQFELTKKCQMLKAENQKLWKIKEIVKDVVLIPDLTRNPEGQDQREPEKPDKKLKTFSS